jgi:hypothetical protein
MYMYMYMYMYITIIVTSNILLTCIFVIYAQIPTYQPPHIHGKNQVHVCLYQLLSKL